MSIAWDKVQRPKKNDSEMTRRILATSLCGGLFFSAIAEGAFAFWPWLFGLPIVSFRYLWILLGSFPIEALELCLVGMLLGALTGIPSRWSWSIVISIGFSYALLYATNSPNFYNIICGCGTAFLIATVAILLRTLTKFLTTKFSNKALQVIRIVSALVVLVGLGFVFGLAVYIPEYNVEVLGMYEVAQANDWQIKTMRFENHLTDDHRNITLYLVDGNVYECVYLDVIGSEYAYGGGGIYSEVRDVQKAIYYQP